ncbi:hypothetical protein BSKO_05402 [Bryopsis sp. KO-2023]|nr:hypothetical protein BSKO_05402 [Bryopsis sp. KO-2023]
MDGEMDFESFLEEIDGMETEYEEGNFVDTPELASQPTDVAGSSWGRPLVKYFDPSRESLVFQQLEVDYVIESNRPVVRMFGVNEAGNSVCALVHKFEPYFYVEAPAGISVEDLPSLQKALSKQLELKDKGPHTIVRIELERKQSVWQYQFGQKKNFLKVVLEKPNSVAPCRAILESSEVVFSGMRIGPTTTYESNILYGLRFMVDCGVMGATWVELPKGKYRVVPDMQKKSTCQIEVTLDYWHLISHPAEGKYSALAPIRILSMDIECCGRKGQFPDPKHDPVIQIASRVTVQGEKEPVVQNIMTLKDCAPIVGAEVMSFDDERDLLVKWQELLLTTDPDVIIGYNICNFDLPYLVQRAETLRVEKRFNLWGRTRARPLKMRDSKFSSKAYGTHEYKEIEIDGRVQFDLLMAIQRDHKMSSYTLNSVSARFLGEQKEDVHHSCISELQNGNAETRRRLAVYCLKDAYLPQRLVDKLMYMYNYVEMARVTGVPLSYLLTRGQSIKVFSQILRRCREKGFLVPTMKVQGQPADGVAYEGATVLQPDEGFYEHPIATLDFASLYPSIMMAHNLCYTTLVDNSRISELPVEHYERSPCGDVFVRATTQKGLLPEILEDLLAARKRAKADLKAAKDPFVKAVLDGRQLALKMSANSVYGFTGATIGRLPCLQISSSVTAYGRDMILHTKNLVMSIYKKENGYEEDCHVIYGDTDSVMVNFKVKDIGRAMELGKMAADEITKTFPKPVKLEFEKVYYPYLLMSKKRYAGLLWTNPEKHDKMDTKGIETVRRDSCLLVRNVVTECLQKILIHRDVVGAQKFVRETIADLLTNKMDLSMLVVSKSLSRDVDKYENKAAHVELAKKMQKRDMATAPGIGDRVPFVIIKAAKGARAYEKAEDPIYALENNLPIDSQHYLDHHLAQPLMRIFEPILKEKAKELLHGQHTKSIIISTPSSSSGGIMRFAKSTPKCMSCKTPLKAGRKTVCEHCESREAEMYLQCLDRSNELEYQFGRLWTQCQRCQGSLLQDVLCTNRDCPIFYRRKKVQKELGEAHKQLARFDDW